MFENGLQNENYLKEAYIFLAVCKPCRLPPVDKDKML